MTKFFVVLSALGVLCGLSVPALAAEDGKIGVVDLQRCMRESVEGERILNELKEKKESLQKQLDKKQDELVELKKDLEKQSMMLSMDAKEDKEKEFERKRREFQYFYKDLREEMKEAEAEAREKMLDELQEVVTAYREQQSYLLILEYRSGGIMGYDKSIDITDEIIKAYNQKKNREG